MADETNDDGELLARVKASAPEPGRDARFWADFRAGIDARIDEERARVAPKRWRWAALSGALAAAAAVAILAGVIRHHHLAGATRAAPAPADVLLPEGDATEMVGDLDDDELRRVADRLSEGGA
jgi:hypothetical protein